MEFKFNIPYKYGEPTLVQQSSFCVSQTIYNDNRNYGRTDIQLLKLGDLYSPWYYHKDLGNKETNCPKETDSVSLLYKIELNAYNPNDIGDLCYNHAHRFGDGDKYYSEALAKSLKEEGQKIAVDCVTHYLGDLPNDVVFKDGSKPSDICVYEGHHRKECLRRLNDKMMVARTYYFYDMNMPITKINLRRYYNSNYNNSFWSSYQTEDSKKPWFTLNHWEDPRTTHKYDILWKCLCFVLENNIQLTTGIDVGGGEGLLGWISSLKLNIPFTIIDSEAGQILRCQFAKMLYNISEITPIVTNWEQFLHYDKYDFGLLLSISHHMSDWAEFLKNFSINKKAIIVEIRHANDNQQICGSIKKFLSKEENEAIFRSTEMNFELIDIIDGDRHFYVLWR